MLKRITAILATVLIATVVIFSGCINSGSTVGNNIITPWGILPLTESSGKDLPCIGKPTGFIRVKYDKTTYEDGETDISLVYYKKGDVFDSVKSEILEKLNSCGFKKNSETEGSFSAPNFKVLKSYEGEFYSSGDTEKDLTVDIVTIEINGNKYTFVSIDYIETPVEENKPEVTQSENTGNYYEQAEEVQPINQEISNLNNEFKNMLVSLFDGAKLVDQSYIGSGGSGVYSLVYAVKRPVESTDAGKIVTEMESMGYNNIRTYAGSDDIEINLQKDNKYVVITGSVGEYQISITVTESG